MSDAVNPDHYKRLPAEAIEIIEAMIAGAPDNKAAYLHGQAAKYDLRLWRKGKSLEDYLTDWQKHIWYALRLESHLLNLIEKQKADEQQKASDLQSHKEHPFGEPKQPAWTPKIGDWVRINAPEPGDPMHTKNLEDLDGHILQVVGQSEFDKRYAAFKSDHGSFYVLIDLLEPAEQPKAHLNSDTIPEGYRKLNDSSIEPRQLGDLRWSVAEKRYIEISVDEIGYANRDNWAACRKVEPVVKQSLPPEPPDGWRFLEEGEVIRDGDKPIFPGGEIKELEPAAIGKKHERPCRAYCHYIRRNRFEVGEKVVDCRTEAVLTVQHTDKQYPIVFVDDVFDGIESKHFAPYIEEAKPTVEVTGEVTGEVKPPEGWRFLEVGEILRRSDATFNSNGSLYELNQEKAGRTVTAPNIFIRRNKFEVGEKVVWITDDTVWTIHQEKHEGSGCPSYVVRSGNLGWLLTTAIKLAPYIEDAK